MSSETAEQALRDDAAARRAALDVVSCIVEAPAGAGKTELLTQRFLRLLATVDSPEEVMAITFTNKAAAEMQSRIVDNLRAAALPLAEPQSLPPHRLLTRQLAGEALAASARHGWHLLDQPERLRVTTIDALCASLARQMPLLSRFGASPAVTTDAGPLYLDAARRTLELLETDNAAFSEPVAAALTYLDNDSGRLLRLLAAMLARRDQWLHAVSVEHESDRALAQLVELELAAIRHALDADWEAALMPIVRFAADTLLAGAQAASPVAALSDWDSALAPTVEELPRWRGLAEFLLTGKGEWRKSFTVAVGLPPGKEGKPWKERLATLMDSATPAREKALARVRLLPALDGREGEDAIVGHFAALLKLATANLWQVFREHGETDFVEVAQRALEALAGGGADSEDDIGEGRPSELALRLDYAIRHLLVDEFQDTSPTQIALLERLTAGWSADDGRTLFCVGDPMQSIYRFRKADVGLFLRAADEGIGGLPLKRLRLSRNNRSLAPVVDWINAAFADVFPASDDTSRGSIAYRASTPTRPDDDAAGVAVHLIEAAPAELDDDQDGGDDHNAEPEREALDRAEAASLLALIDATWAADPARQIAVLVRARPHLAPLVALLRRERPGLRFAAVDVEALAGRQWIADLLALSHALQHRADRVSWLALLRSPLCGLLLADLLVLAGDDHRSTVWSLLGDDARFARLSDDGQGRVSHIRREIGHALGNAGRLGHARLVEGLWRRLGGPATLPDSGASNDVEAFFKLLAELEARRQMTREALEEALARLYAAPDSDSDGECRLHLMTIHKAKGLEFDTVILPGLHRRVRGNDPEMLLWEEVVVPEDGGSKLIVAPMKPAGAGGDKMPTAYDFLRRLDRERGRNEDLRVLYVAATRAVRTLHLVGAVRRVDGEVRPSTGTPLADLWPALNADERQPLSPDAPITLAEKTSGPPASPPGEQLLSSAGQEDGAARPGWGNFVPRLVRQRLAVFAGAVRPAGPDGERGPVGPGRERRPAGQSAAETLVGTLVHRYLELMANDGGAWPAERFDTLRPALRGWLAARGSAGDALTSAVDRACALLKGVVASPAGQWVLARRPGGLAEAAHDTGDGIAVVDRSFVEDGVRWIIDYKTTALDAAARAAGPEGDTHRQALAGGHREQLDRYGRLFASEGLPQRRAILLVDGAFLVETE